MKKGRYAMNAYLPHYFSFFYTCSETGVSLSGGFSDL